MKKCLESIGKDKFDKNLQCNIRLKRACEIAKIKLSYSESTNIILEEYLYQHSQILPPRLTKLAAQHQFHIRRFFLVI